MKIKSEKDFWSGLMFLLAGLAFAWGATEYNFGTSARPGPGYFPLGLGLITAALGALILFKALLIESRGGDRIEPWPVKKGAIVLGAVVVFGFALPVLGMVIALPLLIAIGSLASGEFRIKEVLVNCIVLTLGSWAVFSKGLSLTLPLWPTFLS